MRWVGSRALSVPRVTLGLAGALLVVSGVAVASSQGGGTGDPAPDQTPTVVPAPTHEPTHEPSAPAEVAGVELTPQGTRLALGESATVAWRPRQGLVGVLEVRVEAMQRPPLSVFRGWRVDEAARSSTVYFVRAHVRNVGESDLSGVAVPLYAVDDHDTLVQRSSFTGRFRPCPSEPLPAGFGPGRATETCLVYLVPGQGRLTAVSFRPRQEVEPITWTGGVTAYRPERRTPSAGGRTQRRGGS